MHTFPTVHRHSANCLLTASRQEFNSNFFLWLVVSSGRGIVALWGSLGRGWSHTKWNNSSLLPTSNLGILAFVSAPVMAMKVAGCLMKTGVAVAVSDICLPCLLFPPLRCCFSNFPVVFPLRHCLKKKSSWLKHTCVSFLPLHLAVILRECNRPCLQNDQNATPLSISHPSSLSPSNKRVQGQRGCLHENVCLVCLTYWCLSD